MSVGAPLTLIDAWDRVARWFTAEEAVVDSVARLTFGELDQRSRRAAALFSRLGLKPGQRAAILAPPSVDFVTAWLALVRLGAIPVALHLRESAAASARACGKLEPSLLVYDAALEPLAASISEQSPSVKAAVRLDSALPAERSPNMIPAATFAADLAASSLDFPAHLASEGDPAVIVLSSGTTAVAKGVTHTHRSFVEMARTDLYLYGGLRPGDRSLVPLSTAFIGCYNGWLPFLNAGAAAVFLEHFDLDRLAARVAEERISHLFLTPSLWRRLLASEGAEHSFRSLRLAGFAAEIMDAVTLQKIRDRVTPHVVQMYGSTETGAAATCNFADDMRDERLVSVGRPMLNGELRIVKPGGGLEEVAPGEIGEILVSSPSLAAGIWNDPELTSSAFLDDGRRRWWRSRDLGRLDDRGFLFVEGRHDDMIISAGINIMPARVEEALLTHPDVRECAVVGAPHPDFGEQVQAFVVTANASLTAEDIDRHLLASDLSPYQRPRRYRFVSELPRTATNKINRKRLRDDAANLA